jgi:hypothetical protein
MTARHPGFAVSRFILPPDCSASSVMSREPRPICSCSGHPTPLSSTMMIRSVGRRCSLTWIVPPRSFGNACFKALVAQFVYHKPNANCLLGSDDDVFAIHPNGDRPYASERLTQSLANILKIFLHVDCLIAGRKLELILTFCEDMQACGRAFQSCPNRWTCLRTGLQRDHRGK